MRLLLVVCVVLWYVMFMSSFKNGLPVTPERVGWLEKWECSTTLCTESASRFYYTATRKLKRDSRRESYLLFIELCTFFILNDTVYVCISV